jgi:hypothetical protein
MKPLLCALFLLLPTLGLCQASNSVSLLTFGADPTGHDDAAAAFNRALAAAKHIIVPPGQYLLAGAATVALANVDIECQGPPASANTPPAYGGAGATFLLTSTTVQPFTVGMGVRISNCNFFWPNQTGTTATPIVYPPLFTEVPGTQLGNFDLIGDRIIDAYDVLDAANSADAMGAITLTDTMGYAIRYWFSLANVPETITIKGMIADWNLYQGVASRGKQYLVRWTAANGTFLHVFGNGNGRTTASTVNVAGLVFSGTVFAYNKYVWVESTGFLNEAHFSGIVDAVPKILQVDAGGCIANVKFDALYYSYQWLGAGVDHYPAFSVIDPATAGCLVTGLDIGGQLTTAQGDVLDLTGSAIKTVALHLTGNGSYAGSSTAGTYYFADINAVNAVLTATDMFIQPATSGKTKQGFHIQNCYECVIGGNAFNGVYNPISISAATIPVVGSGNISVASPLGSSIAGTGIYAHQLLQGNSWDLLTTPTLGNCGTTSSVTGNDLAGVIQIGGGTVGACTLTFANAFSRVPKCSFNLAGMPAYLYISAINSSSITITSSSPMTGAQVYYGCQP